MNENDLREALHTTLATSTPPPTMESAPAIAAGRRAVRWRTALAGGGAAVALVAVGALLLQPGPGLFGGGGGGGGSVGWEAADEPSARPTTTPDPDAKTAPVRPTEANGEPGDDATVDSGPRYERGRTVLDEVLASAPDGYTTPDGTAGPDDAPMRDHQATLEDEDWRYLASAAVAKDGGTGRLLAEVHTKGGNLPQKPCDLTRSFWGMGGTCEVVTVGPAKVGVVVTPGADDRLDQWAAYRHSDGVVVYVAQTRTASFGDGGLAPLTALPLTKQQLAALAVDERFDLD